MIDRKNSDTQNKLRRNKLKTQQEERVEKYAANSCISCYKDYMLMLAKYAADSGARNHIPR